MKQVVGYARYNPDNRSGLTMTTVSSEINPIEHTPDNGIRKTTDVEVLTEPTDTVERPQAPNNPGRPGPEIASAEGGRNTNRSRKSS